MCVCVCVCDFGLCAAHKHLSKRRVACVRVCQAWISSDVNHLLIFKPIIFAFINGPQYSRGTLSETLHITILPTVILILRVARLGDILRTLVTFGSLSRWFGKMK